MSTLRYAGYIRVSKEEPSGGFSLDAQERTIRQWVIARAGKLVHIYADGGQSGRTSERDAFQQMRRDAAHHQFDALVVMKFDRLNRNRRDSLAFKSLLRYDYGIAVYSVTEPSEETHGEDGMYIEGLMESVAEWYLHNLSVDMAKAKRERSTQGYQNNQAPFGMKKDEHKVLIADENELPGLLMAFEAYATGKYNDGAIAELLNEAGYRLKSGNRFSKDTVREILQNRVYIGKVKYQEYRRKPDGSTDGRRYERLEWFDGQHQPVINLALFETCQEIREGRVRHRTDTSHHKPNLLKDLVYCERCTHDHPEHIEHFRDWGKMRVSTTQSGGSKRYFRCVAKDYSVSCPQKSVRMDIIEEQVIHALLSFDSPLDWRKRIETILSNVFEEEQSQERLEEIYQLIEKVDFEWNSGFIVNRDDYVHKRTALRDHVRATFNPSRYPVEPASYAGFAAYWQDCGFDQQKQQELIHLLVKGVYLRDSQVIRIDLQGDLSLNLEK